MQCDSISRIYLKSLSSAVNIKEHSSDLPNLDFEKDVIK